MKKQNIFNCDGRLVALDMYGCSFELLNSQGFLITEANKAAQEAQMKVLNTNIVAFQPQGLSIILTLAESHLTIHTAPELGYAAIDVFTCGDGNPMKAAEHLRKVLNPQLTTVKSLRRGLLRQPEKWRESSIAAG